MTWRDSAVASHHSFALYLFASTLRLLQFVMAIVVCGLYGTDLNNARKAGTPADSAEIYAEVVGALAALTALVFLLPFIRAHITFAWDFVIL